MRILALVPTILAVISIPMALLAFWRRFNTRRYKFLLAGTCLLVSVGYLTTRLSGEKTSTLFCIIAWFANATIWFLNAYFLSKK